MTELALPLDEDPSDATEVASRATKISDRRTPELVFAMIEPVGAGATEVAAQLRTILEEKYKYRSVDTITVSDIIRDRSALAKKEIAEIEKHLSDLPHRTKLSAAAKRIESLQNGGNALRKKFGNSYLAMKCIHSIAIDRDSSGYKKAKSSDGSVTDVPEPRRKAYIIDSIKHYDELTLLRDVYGEMCWAIGVRSSEFNRMKRLKVSINHIDAAELMERDSNEKFDYGQKVSKTFYRSDIFVDNDVETTRDQLERFLNLIFGTGVETPTRDEMGMRSAALAASNSACLSRQVGASIVGTNGDLVSVGWNDAPKFGGGLYPGKDADHRCYCDKYCRNDEEKKNIANKIYDSIKQLLKKNVNKDNAISAIGETPVDDLIEFSRAVHAEMEAIISAARNGTKGLYLSSLYVTTFPCHNCAKHIVASGIKEVVFIEPYPKSKATTLHDDSISLDDGAANKTIFRQFTGISPLRAYKLFLRQRNIKDDDGKLNLPLKIEAEPINRPYLDSFTLYEHKVVAEVLEKEAAHGADVGGRPMADSQAGGEQ